MKKILISVLIVLLLIMAYFAIFRGLSIGSFQILSVEQIANENDRLTEQITQTEVLMNNNYPTQTSELEKSISSLLTARDEYLDLASVSSSGELQQANQEEEYTIEFLITELGRHATKQGVEPTLTYSTGTVADRSVQNITFTVVGTYNAIIDFVRAVEDDSKLGFRIQNFKIVPGGSNLQATFTVTNVRIKPETTTRSDTTTSGTNSTNNTNNNQTTQSSTTNQTTTQTNTATNVETSDTTQSTETLDSNQ